MKIIRSIDQPVILSVMKGELLKEIKLPYNLLDIITLEIKVIQRVTPIHFLICITNENGEEKSIEIYSESLVKEMIYKIESPLLQNLVIRLPVDENASVSLLVRLQ